MSFCVSPPDGEGSIKQCHNPSIYICLLVHLSVLLSVPFARWQYACIATSDACVQLSSVGGILHNCTMHEVHI